MTDEQRKLVCRALGLLEREVASVRHAVASGAPIPKTRTLIAALAKTATEFVSTIDNMVGAEAVLNRAADHGRYPRAKTLSHSRPGSTRGMQ